MSLNIMLASPYAVYLSGDFRLSYPHMKYEDNLDTQKIIPIVRYGWGALVSYVGVAKNKGIDDMGVWIRSQLDKIALDADIVELEKKLMEVNMLFRNITSPKLHAFSIVGFKDRKPFMMVISNYLDVEGNITNERSQLTATVKRPKKVEVILTGDTTLANSTNSQNLTTLLKQNVDRQILREAIYSQNVKMSQGASTISKQCVTGYMLASGAFEIGPHGIGEDEKYFPDFITSNLVRNGHIGLIVKRDSAGKALPPKWVGTSGRITKVDNKEFVLEAHAFRNIEKFIHDGKKREGQHMFSRTIEEGDPKSISFIVK